MIPPDKYQSIHELLTSMGEQARNGDYREAEQSYRLALHLAATVYGRHEASVGLMLTYLAMCCEKEGRQTDAESFNRRLREMLRQRSLHLIAAPV